MCDSSDSRIMYSSENVRHTLDEAFMTDALQTARRNELKMLGIELSKLYSEFKTPLNILDIGIGDGHVPVHLSATLWKHIQCYTGIDNSAHELNQCEVKIHNAGLDEKVQLLKLDAINLGDKKVLEVLPTPFHVVVSTYFTAGNFRPDEIQLLEDASGHLIDYPRSALEPNRKFQRVFRAAYESLCDGGKLILGSTYIESPATRAKQEAFYEACGMHVITRRDDPFSAMREGFWSETFSDEKIYTYFDWVPRSLIAFIPLDGEHFARMVVITKRDA